MWKPTPSCPKEFLRYGTEEPVVEKGVAFLESARDMLVQYVKGATHVNVTDEASLTLTELKINTHLLGVIMAQKLGLKAGLKVLDKKEIVSVVKKHIDFMEGRILKHFFLSRNFILLF